MYGHNAGKPVSSYILSIPYLVINIDYVGRLIGECVNTTRFLVPERINP